MPTPDKEDRKLSSSDKLTLLEDAEGNSKLYRNGEVFAEWHYDETPSPKAVLAWVGIVVEGQETELEFEDFPERLAELKPEE